jgi:hypothetical protein
VTRAVHRGRVTSPDHGVTAVWHLTAWFAGGGSGRRLVTRVEYTTDVNQRTRTTEHHASIGAACASLQRFLQALDGDRERS